MTAVDYLINEINIIDSNNSIDKDSLIKESIKVAKLKERNQIEEAYRFGKLNCYQVANKESVNVTAVDYYNDKYSEI